MDTINDALEEDRKVREIILHRQQPLQQYGVLLLFFLRSCHGHTLIAASVTVQHHLPCNVEHELLPDFDLANSDALNDSGRS